MTKIELNIEDFQALERCLNTGVDLPEDLAPKLFPTLFEKMHQEGKFDYQALHKYKIPTIEYSGKRPESVILNQTKLYGGYSPLQVERCFEDGNQKAITQLEMFTESQAEKTDWRNLIIQGDNLQFLKTCYLNQDPLIKDKVKGQIKLIYIDPPFATKSDFGGKDGERSYSDKVATSEFIEALRERLIFLRELLADDGSIYLHLDQKMSHYAKIVMDEVFGKDNFLNEVVWYYRRWNIATNLFAKNHDIIFLYTKNKGIHVFNNLYIPKSEKSSAQGKAWKSVIGEDGIRRSIMTDEETKGVPMPDVWEISMINPVGLERTKINYPTQKPEALLERIILASSNPGDLVLDCFGGSGTTASVAEKLGRRWIVCDFGKHAIYTMQKRILEIADSKKLGKDVKNEKYGKQPQPFYVAGVGAYDFSRILNLRENKDAYIQFVLELFGITHREDQLSNKYRINNIYAEQNNHPVEVYPIWDDVYLKEIRIDEEYLRDIISQSGGKLKGEYYIITPETCTIVGETELKNSNNEKVTFKFLTFPYKILEEVARNFQLEEQPSSADNINNLVSSVGFYFNQKVEIELKKTDNGLEVSRFQTDILSKDKKRFEGLEGLAMLIIDLNYDNNVFKIDQAVYLKDIKDNQVTLAGVSENTAVIAVDKYGNESPITKVKG